ncbi:F0F1 ATP synthase subunit gamma [Desulfogranum japonicum]|uniref:F0F1 ATP synthase subunit gamma n=1 Tax=Desulfogranum japonicum TaxID=231447 RepID=UPI00042A4CB3|nr:F0F1 ATP synthase subunit gamma [Desulfogranum japonicum]
MSKRRDLEKHRHGLAEIRNIMNSMKTLAYLETRKLSRYLGAQQAVVEHLENVAEDILGFYPEILPTDTAEMASVYVVIGTERGFCGDFNYTLAKQYETIRLENASSKSMVIAIGHKLHVLLEGDDSLAACIAGASVAEEVTSLLKEVISTLTDLHNTRGLLEVYCLYHGNLEGVVIQRLLPPFQQVVTGKRPYRHPPILNLSPQKLLFSLMDQYLFALLNDIFFTSLLMENQHRVSHLEGAVKRLDDEAEELARKCNMLRQEELIEEIEVILLSSALP